MELEKRAGLDGRKVGHFVEGDPRLPDGPYDPVERIRTTGDVETNISWLCGFGAVLLLLNAAGWVFFPRPKSAVATPPAGQGGSGFPDF